jgi:putative DNA primase/helicase
MSHQAAFLDFCRSVGLGPLKAVDFLEGKLTRWRGEGDKAGAQNCWGVLYTRPTGWGLVGSWRTGAQHHWREIERETTTVAERAEQRRQMEQARQARADELTQVQASAREKAARLWAVSRPATDAHPYLQRKGVHAFGLHQLGPRLVIPARDVDGVLHTLQFIDGDGSKRFLTGGRIAGCYCAIGTPGGDLLICEGYATAASLYMATGQASAAAFSAGNLQRVAVALRGKFPALRIVICADNDTNTPGNPGRTAALQAARAAGALVALPHLQRTE